MSAYPRRSPSSTCAIVDSAATAAIPTPTRTVRGLPRQARDTLSVSTRPPATRDDFARQRSSRPLPWVLVNDTHDPSPNFMWKRSYDVRGVRIVDIPIQAPVG